MTAFWLPPERGARPPELGIDEIRSDYPDVGSLTKHGDAPNNQAQDVFTAPRSLCSTYSRYGALITSQTITSTIDGMQRGRTRRQAGETAKLFVFVSLYTGTCNDGWAGCPSRTTGWSADSYVRWVRDWAAPEMFGKPCNSAPAVQV